MWTLLLTVGTRLLLNIPLLINYELLPVEYKPSSLFSSHLKAQLETSPFLAYLTDQIKEFCFYRAVMRTVFITQRLGRNANVIDCETWCVFICCPRTTVLSPRENKLGEKQAWSAVSRVRICRTCSVHAWCWPGDRMFPLKLSFNSVPACKCWVVLKFCLDRILPRPLKFIVH